MALDSKLRKAAAIMAVPAALLAIGAGYERGGLVGLHDLSTAALHAVGLTREAPQAKAPAPVTLTPDEAFWLSIKDSRAPGLYEEFLKKFPDSPRAGEARAKLQALEKLAQPAAPGQPTMPMNGQGRRPMMMRPGG
jgi:hypothetical protein